MEEEWITTAEASELLNISERQVRNRATNGKLKAKREGNKWMIHRSLAEVKAELEGNRSEPATSAEISESSETIMAKLESDNEWLRKRVEELEKHLGETRKSGENASERHDTIVLQLTRHLEQSQRLLEYHEEPFYRKWFKKRKRPEDEIR
ncbi:helix-turn-helix domain-containing protein [Candidatus Poribacteria bacterium]